MGLVTARPRPRVSSDLQMPRLLVQWHVNDKVGVWKDRKGRSSPREPEQRVGPGGGGLERQDALPDPQMCWRPPPSSHTSSY